MRQVCAWCNCSLDGSPNQDEVVSHGICLHCKELVISGRLPLSEFLERIGAPVVVVDGNVRAQAANAAACKTLGKGVDEITGSLGGDFIQCSNAALPGGCGRSVNCAGCMIRHTVTDTYQTGSSHVQVPAYQKLQTPEGPVATRFVFSTERVGEVVVMRIDAIERSSNHSS